MNNLNNFNNISNSELEEIQGGIAPLIIAGALIATPFVLGAVAGGFDEYARKKGHR